MCVDVWVSTRDIGRLCARECAGRWVFGMPIKSWLALFMFGTGWRFWRGGAYWRAPMQCKVRSCVVETSS